MTKAALYLGLDILATVLEAVTEYICIIIFCKRYIRRILEVLPYAVTILLVSVMTWIIPLGIPKIIIPAVIFLILQRLIIKEKWHKLIASYALYHMLLVLNDFISLIAVTAIFGRTSTMVGDMVVNIWQYYLIKMSMLAAMIWGLYKVFGNYDYEIQPRDAVFLFLYAVLTFTVMYASIGYGFFAGDVNWFDFTIAISCALFGLLLLLLFLYQKNSGYLKYQRELARQKVWELEQKHAYYEEKLKNEERVRAIYHDMKNHLLLMEQREGSNGRLRQTAESLRQQISDFENYYHTGNEFLDVILCDKAKKAKEQQIDFSAIIQFESGKFIEPLDISAIFGNALDNALEASIKLPAGQRLITVKANRIHDMLVIVFKNNMLSEKDRGRGTTKEDVFLHGFGLKNLKQAVEKYEGECTIHQDQGEFILKMIIPIP